MHSVTSPSGNLTIDAGLDDAGRLGWSVRWGGDEVIARSCLRLLLSSGEISQGFLEIGAEVEEVVEAFDLPSGKADRAEVPMRRLRLDLEHEGRPFTIWFTAANDAAALRWGMDVRPGERLIDERLEWRFVEDVRTWSLDCPNFRSSFEGEYESRPVSNLIAGDRRCLPLTFWSKTAAGVIHEAAVTGHAGSMISGHLHNPLGLETGLSPRLNDDSGAAVLFHGDRHVSPWRVVLLADHPGTLIESNTLLALNPPSKIEDTSWIRPGRVTWDWWCGPVAPGRPFKAGMNTETFEFFVDFAAEVGIEYCMIDGG
ncbi:MAG: glycoside hydrolase family 97 N-terminal domain-containing protein, partial [Fimbriimonadaceae bacterium]|nr:glycoside hydrolase family 97 N-terminal domain-containing protein [Fimbriimonadaceae bacterium]